ncbi:MAG: nitroreductase family protein [Planctomycetes bacterium]|nr:nitroreductase family protein [Planctomycetota bacterium]
MEALRTLAARRSVRRFKSQPVPRDVILRLIDAARLAPTARNVQPWEFVVVTNPNRLRQLASSTDHGKFISDAPVCIVVLSRDTKYFLEDCSAATTNLLLAAAAQDLGACWVAGDKKPYASQIVSLCGAPPELKLVSLVAIGYPNETPSPPKRSIEDVLHWETF